MPPARCQPDFLPWLLAWEQDWLPIEECKHELIDLGGDEYLIILGNHGTVDSKVLIKYDHNWGY